MKNWIVVIASLFALSSVGCAHKSCKGDGHGPHKQDHHSKMWDMMDANKDGSVTKAEFDKAHGEKFTMMDANKDGKITKEEMMAHKKEKMGEKKGCCGGDK